MHNPLFSEPQLESLYPDIDETGSDSGMLDNALQFYSITSSRSLPEALATMVPETWEKVSHGEPTFWVHKRMFAMFASARNHHGAGRDAVWCKAVHMTQEMVVSRWPDRYFVPPYCGVAGWFGIYLDRRPDWRESAGRGAA